MRGGILRKHFIRILCLFCLIFTFTLTGCKDKSTNNSFPSSFVWNNTIYSLTPKVVSSDELGKEIGQLEKKVQDIPKENGETNDGKIGSKIFEIKKVKTTEAVAVEFKGKIRKANKCLNLNTN